MRSVSDELQKFLDSRELFGWQLGLSRVRRLSRLLGEPHRHYSIIHIAGTNGKGSTAAMLEAVLKAAAFRTGLYTSPHLVSVTERIRIEGLPISIDNFETILKQQKQLLEAQRATYFEALTSVAFSAFAEAKVEVAIVEVGLGGRLDATNIVRPVLCVIPSIGFDHQKYLGRTLSAIAAEKAGILKRRVPCVIGKMSPGAARTIAERAQAIESQVFDAWQLCKVRSREITAISNRLSISTDTADFDALRCNLIGRHQMNNILCAVVAAQTLNRRGINIDEAALRSGLQHVNWPGRFQIFQQRPTIVFDVAHNPAGMRAFIETFKTVYPGRRPVVVLGVLADKEYQKMLNAWRPVASHLIFCRIDSARALPPEQLYGAAHDMNLPSSIIPDASRALDEAKRRAGHDGIVCVTGSHYVVGRLLGDFTNRKKTGKIS